MEFLTTLFVGYPIWVWLMFMLLVVGLLAFDLGVLHKGNEEIDVKESLKLFGLLYCDGFAIWSLVMVV